MKADDVLRLQQLHDPGNGVRSGGQQEDSDFSILCGLSIWDCDGCSTYSFYCGECH